MYTLIRNRSEIKIPNTGTVFPNWEILSMNLSLSLDFLSNIN